jgi:hypothetical protein
VPPHAHGFPSRLKRQMREHEDHIEREIRSVWSSHQFKKGGATRHPRRHVRETALLTPCAYRGCFNIDVKVFHAKAIEGRISLVS